MTPSRQAKSPGGAFQTPRQSYVVNKEEPQRNFGFVFITQSGIHQPDRTLDATRSLELPARWKQELEAIEQLEAGWDGDQAEPISVLALNGTRVVLKTLLSGRASLADPALVPTPDGAMQVEWHEKDRSLELGFTGTKWVALGVELDGKGEVLARHTTSFATGEAGTAVACYAWYATRDPRRAAWPSR